MRALYLFCSMSHWTKFMDAQSAQSIDVFSRLKSWVSARCYWYILLNHPIRILDLEEYINSGERSLNFWVCWTQPIGASKNTIAHWAFNPLSEVLYMFSLYFLDLIKYANQMQELTERSMSSRASGCTRCNLLSIQLNLKIISAISVHREYCSIQNSE